MFIVVDDFDKIAFRGETLGDVVIWLDDRVKGSLIFDEATNALTYDDGFEKYEVDIGEFDAGEMSVGVNQFCQDSDVQSESIAGEFTGRLLNSL